MDKRQLVATAARRTSLSRSQMREAVDVIFEAIADALACGDTVALSDFGRFSVQDYPGRELSRFGGQGHYKVDSRPIPVFKSSQALRRRLRGDA
jgi:nucleoid DNA-binding protein